MKTEQNEMTTEDLNRELQPFSLVETRSIRGSADTFFSDTKPENPKMLAKDHGEKHNKKARYEIFEYQAHEVKVKMNFGGDTLMRIARYAFSELWIKKQATERKLITSIGDEEYIKRLKDNDHMIEANTATDFVPKSRAMSSADKAQGEIGKISDMDDLARLEEQIARQREKILSTMKQNNKK